MKNLKRVLMATLLMSATLIPGYAQNTDIPERDENTDKKPLIHKGMIWAQKSMNFKNPDLTALFVNVVKHPNWKGFGLMSVVATRPLNIGTQRAFIPQTALFLNYGNAKNNINVGPVTQFDGGALVDRFRVIGNAGGETIALRLIADFDEQDLLNVGLHGIVHLSSAWDATLGVNSAPSGDQSINAGMALKF